MDIDKYKVTIELTEPLLGTVPKNKNIYTRFIASKAVDAGLAQEEAETVEEMDQKGHTGYHKDENGYFLYDYSIKGFMCEAARTIKQFGALKQLNDKYKRYVFVRPRRIRLPDPTEVLERPLRAMTAQGPRIALARSDVIPAGTKINFGLEVLQIGGITEGNLREIFGYGRFIGLGQWRSGSYGRFELTSLEEV